MSDDAYLTLRTVDNWVNGYGPVWNVGERVQAYTHPLWMLVISAVYFFTREPYFTTLFLSIGIAALAAWIFSRKVARSDRAAALGLVLLVFSKPFVDYSTSGLESPLTYLLLALFFWRYLTSSARPLLRLFWLALLGGLLGLNRLDITLLVLPPLAYAFRTAFKASAVSAGAGETAGRGAWPRRFARTAAVSAAGLVPLVLWFGFSLIYYGFLFPNTAYAKLNVNIPPVDLVRQGVYYLLDTLMMDPLTLLAIGAAMLAAGLTWKKPLLPVCLGMILYIVYILRIGGDFMSGRLLAPVFLCAVIVLAQYEWPLRQHSFLLFLFSSVLLVELVSPYSNLFSGRNYRLREEPGSVINDWGIADERGFYYRYTGLLRARPDASSPHLNNWIVGAGMDLRQRGVRVTAVVMAGMGGFYAGPQVHIIDQMALADPFLARLPFTPPGRWRIGHFQRALPCGYYQTFVTGTNQLADPGLAAYLDKMNVIIRGPLFTLQRWREIWNINTGKYQGLLKGYNPQMDCNPIK